MTAHRQSLGRYELLERAEELSAGTLLRGRDLRLSRDVMLKSLGSAAFDHRALQRYYRESDVLSRLDHPNIAASYGLETVGNTHYLVMEYVPGELLGARLCRECMKPREVVRLGIQIAEGVLAAHAVGVIHRDISPESLWLPEAGGVRLLEFGMAELKEATADSSSVFGDDTAVAHSAELLSYMAPERLSGQQATPLMDLYSIGAVLYQALTGQRPYEAPDVGARINAILDGKLVPQFSENVPVELQHIVLRCLESRPEYRYQSASELLGALSGAAGDDSRVDELPECMCEGGKFSAPHSGLFVGRESEMAALEKALVGAKAGRGTIRLLTGEAGAGKSTLGAEFIRRALAGDSELLVTMGACKMVTGSASPYGPFREALALLTGDIAPKCQVGAIEREHAIRLWRTLPEVVALLTTVTPALVDVFVSSSQLVERASAHAGARPWCERLEELGGNEVRRGPTQTELFKQCTLLLQRLSRGRTIVCFFEDLQWADQGSIALLTHLMDHVESSHLLIIGTYRSEEVGRTTGPECSPLAEFLSRCKARLGDVEVRVGYGHRREFMDAYLDASNNRLGKEFRSALYGRTQGHALFVSEMVGWMRDEGMVSLDLDGFLVESGVDWDRIPSQIELAIGERIERLPSDLRRMLAVASVEGQTFTSEVIAKVTGTDVETTNARLHRDLDEERRLVVADGVRDDAGRRLSMYRFGHALFQQYTYQTLDAIERAHLHEAVGVALEELYGDHTGPIAADLARHFEEAGLFGRALDYACVAGHAAVRASALPEAIVDFERALRIVARRPDDSSLVRREMELQAALGRVLMEVRGYGHDSVLEAFGRAYELSVRLNDASDVAGTIVGLWAHALVNLDLKGVKQWAGEALSRDDPSDHARTFAVVGALGNAARLVVKGSGTRAVEWADRLLALPNIEPEAKFIALMGQAPWGVAMCWRGLGLWLQGDFGGAEAMVRANFEYVRALEHPASLAMSLAMVAHMFEVARDFEAAAPIARECIQLSRLHGFELWEVLATFVEGDRRASGDDRERGIAVMKQASDTLESSGLKLFGTHRRVVIAEALGPIGQIDEALELLDEAQRLADNTGEMFYAPEIHRVRAVTLDRKGDVDASQVARLLGRGICLARRQGGRALELRALCGLVRWRSASGTAVRRDAALKALAVAYARFPPGFDNPDLRVARGLLPKPS